MAEQLDPEMEAIFAEDAPPSEAAAVEMATGEALDPEMEAIFSGEPTPAAPPPVQPMMAGPAVSPEEPAPQVPGEIQPLAEPPEEETPAYQTSDFWVDEIADIFTPAEPFKTVQRAARWVIGGTGQEDPIVEKVTTDKLSFTITDLASAVGYAEVLGIQNRGYSSEPTDVYLAGGAVEDPSYYGTTIGEVGDVRQKGITEWTPRAPSEEFHNWYESIEGTLGMPEKGPLDPTRINSARDILDNAIDEVMRFQAMKMEQWVFPLHPLKYEDLKAANLRLQQLQGMRDILDAGKYNRDQMEDGVKNELISAVFGIAAAKAHGKNVEVSRDEETGQFSVIEKEYTDPLVGKSAMEQAAIKGIDYSAERLYTRAAQGLGSIAVAGKMLLTDLGPWMGRSIGTSWTDEFSVYAVESAIEDENHELNIDMVLMNMGSKGMKPISPALGKTVHGMADDAVKAEFSRLGLPLEQAIVYLEARRDLPEFRTKMLKAAESRKTIGAPVQGLKAVGHHYGQMVEDYGLLGTLFVHEPLDGLTLVSLAGTAAVKTAGLAAKTQSLVRMAGQVGAAPLWVPEQLWGKIPGVMRGNSLTARLSRFKDARRLKQTRELGRAKRLREHMSPEALEQLGEISGDVAITGGEAHRILKSGRRRQIGPVAKGERPGAFIVPEAEAKALKVAEYAQRLKNIGGALENFDPILFSLNAPSAILKRVGPNSPAMMRFLNKPSEFRQAPMVYKGETMTVEEVLMKEKALYDRKIKEVSETFEEITPEVMGSKAYATGDETVAEAIHRTLKHLVEEGKVDPQHMFIARLREGSGAGMGPYEPLELSAIERKAWDKAGSEPPDPTWEAAAQAEKTAFSTVEQEMRNLPPSNRTFDRKTPLAKVLDQGAPREVYAYLLDALEGSPLHMERLADHVKKISELRASLKGAKKKDIPKIKAKIEEAEQTLRSWARKDLENMHDPGSIWSGLDDQISILNKDPAINPTKGLPSLLAMAEALATGKSLPWIPAHHISVAKTIAGLRRLKQAIKPYEFENKWVRYGDKTITADSMLQKFGNNKLIDNYISMLDNEFQLMGHDALKNVDVVYSHQLPMGTINVKQMDVVAKHARSLRKLLLEGGMDSVRAGNLEELTFWRNLSNYGPEFYKKYTKEFTKSGVGEKDWVDAMHFMTQQGYNGDRMKKSVLKALKTIHEREGLGLITDPRFYVAKTMHQLVSDVHYTNFVNHLRKAQIELDGNWVDAIATINKETGLGQYTRQQLEAMGFQRTGFVRKLKKPSQFREKPVSKKQLDRWGPLYDQTGKVETWLHPEVYHYLKGTRNADHYEILAYINQVFINRWKAAHTILSPPTHMRNVFSNLIMGDMAGMNPVTSKSARDSMKGTWKEYFAREGKIIDEAIEGNLFGSTFADAEMKEFLRQVARESPDNAPRNIPKKKEESIFDVASKFIQERWNAEDKFSSLVRGKPDSFRSRAYEKFRKAYVAEDEIFKLWRFKQIRILQKEFQRTGRITRDMQRALGKDHKYILEVLDHADGTAAYAAAAKNAHQWFFDYSDVPGWVEVARKTNMPFFTYSYKAIPQVAKWLNAHPVKAFMWRQWFDWMNFSNEFMDGEPDWEDVYAAQEGMAQLPGYARLTSVPGPPGEAREFAAEEVTKVPGQQDDRRPGGRIRLAPSFDVQFWTQLGGWMKAGDQYESHWYDHLIQNPLVETGFALGNVPTWDKFGRRGASIWNAEDSFALQVSKWGQEMSRIWLPSWTPGLPQEWRGDRMEDGEPVDDMTVRETPYSEWGIPGGLLSGGRSWQKLMAYFFDTPDYRQHRTLTSSNSKFRQLDELAGELLAFRFNWTHLNSERINEQYKKEKKRLETKKTTAVNNAESERGKAREKARYDEMLEFIEDYKNEVLKMSTLRARRYANSVWRAR